MRMNKRIIFRLVSFMLIMAIIFSRPVAHFVNAKTITSSVVQSKLNTLLGQFPANSPWNRSFAGGSQCYAFAHYIFNTIFDRGNTQVGNGAVSSNSTCYKLNNVASDINTIGILAPGYSLQQLEKLLEKAMPGDYLQVKRRNSGNPHSMIVTGVDSGSNTIGIFDANAVAANTVGQYSQSFSYFMERNVGVSLYRYNGYVSVDSCNCNESYAGTYTVTTSSLPLNIRSGHGEGYSVIASIPKGEEVYVSKADGSWAHVSWGGYSGYSAIKYLTKKIVSAPMGVLDEGAGRIESVYIKGWAFDQGYPGETLEIHVYIGGAAGKGTFLGSINANVERKDVNAVYGAGNYHGFAGTFKTSLTGNQVIYVYAVNKDKGTNCLLAAEKKVTILKPTPTPVVKVDSISINYMNYMLANIGESVQLVASITPTNAANKNVVWSSSDTLVASVDKNGKVTAKSNGTTIITAQSQDGGKKVNCIIKVNSLGLFFGDLDGSKIISVTDLSTINKISNGQIIPTTSEKELADLDGNGVINQEDVKILTSYIQGTIQFFPTESKLRSIQITKKPTKLVYYQYDAINTVGLEVVATYNNAKTKIIKNGNVRGSTEKIGKQVVTIEYTEGRVKKTATYTIEVKAKVVKTPEIKVTETPKVQVTRTPGIRVTETPKVQVTRTPEVKETEPPQIQVTRTPIVCVTKIPTPTEAPNLEYTSSPSVTNIPIPTKDVFPTMLPKETPVVTEEPEEEVDLEEIDFTEEGDVIEVKNAYYQITQLSEDGGTVTYLSPISKKKKSEIIPSSIVYNNRLYKVTRIGKNAFKNHKKLTTVTIGANVSQIEAYAFFRAKKLCRITIKSSKITKIGVKAFYGLKRGAKVRVPKEVRTKYVKMLKKAGYGKR